MMRVLFILLIVFGSLRVAAQNGQLLTSIAVTPGVTPVIFLDTDGYQVEAGSRWSGYTGGNGFYAEPSGMTASELYIAYTMVAEDFRPFDVAITTDSSVYEQAPFDKRIRVVFTTTSSWYSNWNGGVAQYGSFTFGDDTPVWVFTSNLHYSGKFTGDCASHESGHAFNLIHHGTYDENCNRQAEYNYGGGEGETGWGPIMGATYHVNIGTWDNGDSIRPLKCTAKARSDVETINRYLKYRDEPNQGNGNMKEIVVRSENGAIRFIANGIIERRRDKDGYELELPARTHLKLSAHSPLLDENMGFANNLDIKLSFGNSRSASKSVVYAPFDKVGVDIDTTIDAGRYFIEITGDGNANMSDYGSLGSFEITGTGTTTPNALLVKLGNDTSVCVSNIQTAGYNIKAAGLPGNTQILWSTGDTTAAINVFEPGTYWVTVSNSGTEPKVASDTITISPIQSVVPGFTLSNYDADACKALITVHDITTSLCGNLQYVAYNFGAPGDTSSALTMPGGSISNLYEKEGTYLITQTVIDIAGNRFTYSREVRIDNLKKIPVNILGPDQKICEGAFATIGNSSIKGNWNWQDSSMVNATRRVGPGQYIAFVDVYDSKGEPSYCMARDTITIATSESLVPNFTTKEVASLAGATIKFTNRTTTCDGTPPSRFRWIFGDGSESNEPNPEHQYRTSGRKLVTLIASTPNSTETIEKIVNIASLKSFDGRYPKLSMPIPKRPVVNHTGSSVHLLVEAVEPGGSFFQIINLSGQVLRTGRIFTGSNTIDINPIAKGVFFLRINQQVYKLWKP